MCIRDRNKFDCFFSERRTGAKLWVISLTGRYGRSFWRTTRQHGKLESANISCSVKMSLSWTSASSAFFFILTATVSADTFVTSFIPACVWKKFTLLIFVIFLSDFIRSCSVLAGTLARKFETNKCSPAIYSSFCVFVLYLVKLATNQNAHCDVGRFLFIL